MSTWRQMVGYLIGATLLPSHAQTAGDAVEFLQRSLRTCEIVPFSEITSVFINEKTHFLILTSVNRNRPEIEENKFNLTEVDFNLGDRYYNEGSKPDRGQFALQVQCINPGCFSTSMKSRDAVYHSSTDNRGLYACEKELILRMQKALLRYQKEYGRVKAKF
jgi:hypothetical protein